MESDILLGTLGGDGGGDEDGATYGFDDKQDGSDVLAEAAEKSWRRLNGRNQLPKLILGVKFADGIEVVRPQAQAAAA